MNSGASRIFGGGQKAGYATIDSKSGAGEKRGDQEAGEDGKRKKTYGVHVASTDVRS